MSTTAAGESIMVSIDDNDCIFVGNLPKKYTKLQLEKIVKHLFTSYGTVDYTKASMDKKGRPYCFVKFQNPTIPKKILSDEIILDNRLLRVEMAKGQLQKPSTAIAANTVTTIINGDNILIDLSRLGITDGPPASPSSPSTPINSPTVNNGITGESRHLHETLSPISSMIDLSLISVANLNIVFVSEQLLQKYFSKYGAIESVKLFTAGIGGGCRPGSVDFDASYGLIKFVDSVCAQRAIFNEDGNIWLGKTLKVTVGKPIDRPHLVSVIGTRPYCVDDAASITSSYFNPTPHASFSLPPGFYSHLYESPSSDSIITSPSLTAQKIPTHTNLSTADNSIRVANRIE